MIALPWEVNLLVTHLILESLTNSEIIKFGGNQDTTFDLSIRVGRTKIFANNITIPGDKEAVDLTFYNEKGEQVEALKNSGSNFDEVTIQGIKGTLAYDSSRNIHTLQERNLEKLLP